jgi:hypothetical protein
MGALEPHLQSGIGPVGRLPLDQQGELIIEVELAAVVQPDQLLQPCRTDAGTSAFPDWRDA